MGRWENVGHCPRCGGTIRRYHGPTRTEEDITTGRVFEYRDGEVSECWDCSNELDRMVAAIPAFIWRRQSVDARKAAATETWQLDAVARDERALEKDQRHFNSQADSLGKTIPEIFELYKKLVFKRG